MWKNLSPEIDLGGDRNLYRLQKGEDKLPQMRAEQTLTLHCDSCTKH